MSDLELRSRLYAFLADRTSKADGDVHDHDSLRHLARDLAKLLTELQELSQ